MNELKRHDTRKTVIVAEDDPDALDYMVEMLHKFLPTVHFLKAKDGKEVVEIIESRHIDLVCTNINMPRMHGFELIEYIVTNHPRIPVMATSAYCCLPKHVEKIIQLGAYSFETKPIVAYDLFAEKVKIGLEIGKRSTSTYNELVDRIKEPRKEQGV